MKIRMMGPAGPILWDILNDMWMKKVGPERWRASRQQLRPSPRSALATSTILFAALFLYEDYEKPRGP